LYGHIRHELKQINPEVMLTGEDNAEFVIDLLDTALSLGGVGVKAPVFQAVYHGYTLVYGGTGNRNPAHPGIGRWWLLGNQNGWHDYEGVFVEALKGNTKYESYKRNAQYYRKLLHCHYKFARPYLAYGEMLRPPTITGIPTITSRDGNGPYTVPVVEGSTWRAPDGSVGIFFLNYDKEQAHEFSWSVDLGEGADWDKAHRLRLYQWAEDEGLQPVTDIRGGQLTRRARIEPWGLIALKIEVVK